MKGCIFQPVLKKKGVNKMKRIDFDAAHPVLKSLWEGPVEGLVGVISDRADRTRRTPYFRIALELRKNKETGNYSVLIGEEAVRRHFLESGGVDCQLPPITSDEEALASIRQLAQDFHSFYELPYTPNIFRDEKLLEEMK